MSVRLLTSLLRPWVALALVGLLFLGACGGDDAESDASEEDSTSTAASATPADSISGSASDSDLVVPRDYLQGEWCDSEGQSWTIEGDTARFEDGSGGVGEFPVDIVFIKGIGVDLIAQTDSEFTFGGGGDEVTFTRGGC
ncbi:MAG: hypothetical protein R3C39_03770 [Dehalococcoidia bacterium]